MNKAARNERRKITAAFINNIATSIVVTGAIVPFVSASLQLAATPLFVYLAFTGWIASGLVLHEVARRYLKRIEE